MYKNLSFFFNPGLLRYSTSRLVPINQFFMTQTMTAPNFACSSVPTSRLSSLAAVISAWSLGPSSWTFKQFALQINEKCILNFHLISSLKFHLISMICCLCTLQYHFNKLKKMITEDNHKAIYYY